MIRISAVILVALVAAIVQATVPPLFPLMAATPDLALLAILGIAHAAGPRTGMVMTPILALMIAFGSARSPGLAVLAYLPILPLAYGAQQLRLPLGRFLRILGAGLAAGLWVRGVYSADAFIDGATLSPLALVRDVLVAGIVYDFVLLSLLYVPIRLLGWHERSLSLQPKGWL